MGAFRSGKDAGGYGPSSPIPDKLYFKIGEVCDLVGVEAHVLRYWEKEVPTIRPAKSASNQRRYRRKDVEHFRQIRRLLHEERYTLAGARRQLFAERTRPPGSEQDPAPPEATRQEELAPEASSDQLAGSQRRPMGSALEPPKLVCGLDDACRERLRAGLRELVRLAGEEP